MSEKTTFFEEIQFKLQKLSKQIKIRLNSSIFHLNIPEMTADVICEIAKLQCDDLVSVGHDLV